MNKQVKLAAEIDAGYEIETYDVFGSAVGLNKSNSSSQPRSVLDSSYLKSHEVPSYEVAEKKLKKQRAEERGKTKGKDWFNMKVGDLTEEAKNDLAVIKMRGGLHKDRFYKANDSDVIPKFFQMGTVVDDPTDFYSDRVPRKQQKKTILEELINDAAVKKFTKKNYSAIQEKEEKRRKHLARLSKRIKKR